MKKLLLLCTLLAASAVCNQAQAQQAGVKTNLLYDATTTFNLGAEFRLGERTSLDIPINWNPFTFNENRKWKHVLVQPEARFWTKETFAGHFFGIHGHYAYFNASNLPQPFSQYVRDRRFEGWLVGAGVSYGYRWNFSDRWGLEATLGVGYAYLEYDKYTCGNCGEGLGSGSTHYFGPTKAGISIIYSIGQKKQQPAPAPIYIPLVVTKGESTAVVVNKGESTAVVVNKGESAVVSPYTTLSFSASYVVPEAQAVKVRSEAGKAYLDFAAGESEIIPSFKGNSAELEKIYAMIREVRENPNAEITGITITGYASPEGAYAANLTLSERRAMSLKNQIRMVTGYPDGFFTVQGRGEDWDTLYDLVSQSNMAEKYTILDIIRSMDYDVRERRLMLLADGEPYRTMKNDLFPRLRRIEYQLHYTVLPFTVKEGEEVFRTRPSSLSLNEMFLIANGYTPGSNEFNEVFETAARIFPQDDTANLNAAASSLSRGDALQAERYLAKVRVQTPAYHNNMGVLYGLRGEWEKAGESFRRAQAAGNAEAESNVAEIQRRLQHTEAARR